ncbi:MAG: hypothetical protein JXB15_05810 [Anaerolineales bacterium]|nr:hypothetical protein [Anaerolineales bacterium]
MTVLVEKLPDEPIIVADLIEPMDYYKDIPEMFARIVELRDTIVGCSKYYAIIDMSGIKADFSEIVFSLSEARKASKRRLVEFPVSVHLVGTGDLFEMVANAAAQVQYGGYKAPLYKTRQEALDAIHTDLANESA